jgi:hypothetical protein
VSPVYSALVHFPVRTREGADMTSAITNLDVHDIARSATTFGLMGFYVVTPITAQRALVDRILEHWDQGPGRARTPERSRALSICRGAESVEQVIASIAETHGQPPRVLATAARSTQPHRRADFDAERRAIAETSVPRLILFGTAHGLADRLIETADALLPPIVGVGDYNHLSVRAAAAITFDRLLGAQRPEN